MAHYVTSTYTLALTLLKRNLRDPITTIVLFGIPVLLILVFGTLLGNTNNISLRVAVINNSNEPFAAEFEKTLKEIAVFKLPDEVIDLDQARDRMNNDKLDGIIELPSDFGAVRETGPSGAVRIYYDETDTQTGDIVASVMQSVVDGANNQIANVTLPFTIERSPINVTEVRAIDTIFSMFTAMAVMMVGVFGVASLFPGDKKSGVLRRMRVTPFKSSQMILATTGAFAAVGIIGITIMTLLSVIVFDLQMRGSWLTYGIFMLFALLVMLGFGLAIGSIAKNSTQADILGQIVFLASLSVSGVWFPRALMPEFLQNLTFFMPLTPVIEGIRSIITEGATLLTLGPEWAVLAGWGIIVYFAGTRLFRWG